MNKELIKQWGENTAYSAKCHYKTADLKRNWLKMLIIINILFAIFSLLDLNIPTLTKIFGIISLIASVLILVYESREDKDAINKYMKIGDEYLNIHYQLQEIFYKDVIDKEEFEKIKNQIEKLNKKPKPIINQFAKKMAKKAIEKKGEMNKWWK